MCFCYTDLDGDKIMIINEEDFKRMLKNVKGVYVKLEFVQESCLNCLDENKSEKLLDDIKRSRLINQQQGLQFNNQKIMEFQDHSTLGKSQNQQNFKKETLISRITNRTFRIPEEDIIQFEQYQKITPIKNTQNQKNNDLQHAKISERKNQQRKMDDKYLNQADIQDNLRILINDRVKYLINQKVEEMVPKIEKKIRKEVQENFIQQSRRNQLDNFQKLSQSQLQKSMKNKKNCKHKQDNQKIQLKVEMKIAEQSFKLSQQFGGKPIVYENFVRQNFGLKSDKLKQIYKKNLLQKHLLQISEKLQKRINKLGSYFNQNPQKYRQLVINNPELKFNDLLKKIESSQERKAVTSKSSKNLQKSRKGQQYLCQNSMSSKNLAFQIPIKRKNRNYSEYDINSGKVSKEDKQETRKHRIKTVKMEKFESQRQNIQQLSKKSIKFQIPKMNFKKSKIRYQEVQDQIQKSKSQQQLKDSLKTTLQKKAQFLILFKSLFGVQKIKQYLQFYSKNQTMNEKELTLKWISLHY